MATRLRTRPAARFAALLELVRVFNLVAIGGAAWVGARLARAPAEAASIAIPVLIGAFGYAWNDAADLAADRFNRPGRPLARGALSPRAAKRTAWLFLIVATALVALARRDPGSLLIAATAAALLAAYSPWLKDRGAAAPAAIALLTVLTVMWGAIGGMDASRALLPALLAGAVQFSRECVKHLEDEAGDRAAGRMTWVVRSGGAGVTIAARLGIIAALLLLPLPTTAGGLRPLYLWLAFPTTGVLLLWALISLGGPTPRHGPISTILKLSLLCGLVTLAIAA